FNPETESLHTHTHTHTSPLTQSNYPHTHTRDTGTLYTHTSLSPCFHPPALSKMPSVVLLILSLMFFLFYPKSCPTHTHTYTHTRVSCWCHTHTQTHYRSGVNTTPRVSCCCMLRLWRTTKSIALRSNHA